MILVIDTTKREYIKIGLYDNHLKSFDIETKDQSADILSVIEDVLGKEATKLHDIKAIAVNQGPGSYTGVRVGVTTANALAWSLDLPVFAFSDGELEESLEKIKQSKEKKFIKLVLPCYQN